MRRKILSTLLFATLGFATTLGIWFLYQSRKTPFEGQTNQSAVFADKLAGAELVTITGDEFHSKQWLTGKVLLIFLSSDCDACQVESSQISEIYPELISHVKVYGVSEDTKEKTAAFVENNKIKFPVVIDQTQKLAHSLMLKGLPTKFILKDGIVEKKILGKFIDLKAAREEMGLSDQ